VVVGFLEAMAVVFLFCLAAWQISEKNLTGIGFISYITAVAMLIDPISHITNDYNIFKQGEASIDRIFELLDVQPMVTDKPQAISLPKITGKVEYQQVGFEYQVGRPVLKNINFMAQPGEMIALVGASGAGKSTLVNLLMRLYNATSGQVLIDDYDVQDVTLKSLRDQIAIVPQENMLFSGTIAQNIAFGQNDLDFFLFEEAAKIANAHQFITELSQGYHTYVGERGVNLSGGQRQRIAIARALLGNPRILVLDEATSSLDTESERRFQRNLEQMSRDRTTIIIAHRLSTVRNADQILVLDQGVLVEKGNHQQLMETQGLYYHLAQQQLNL
jgi:ATP-binding cassette subfamily B protein